MPVDMSQNGVNRVDAGSVPLQETHNNCAHRTTTRAARRAFSGSPIKTRAHQSSWSLCVTSQLKSSAPRVHVSRHNIRVINSTTTPSSATTCQPSAAPTSLRCRFSATVNCAIKISVTSAGAKSSGSSSTSSLFASSSSIAHPNIVLCQLRAQRHQISYCK